VVTSCGGGLYAHRYRADNGFDNPSAYCPDLLKLITHIRGCALWTRRPPHTVSETAFQALAAGLSRPQTWAS
jgi:uncharacterized protein